MKRQITAEYKQELEEWLRSLNIDPVGNFGIEAYRLLFMGLGADDENQIQIAPGYNDKWCVFVMDNRKRNAFYWRSLNAFLLATDIEVINQKSEAELRIEAAEKELAAAKEALQQDRDQ